MRSAGPGCLIPDGEVNELMLLAHGMASTPERCFVDGDPDYMNAIGKQLCQDGYVVWCPYIVQIGNQESQNNIAAMLASHRISAHNVSCASIDAGETVCRKLTGLTDLNVGVYGVSWGAFLALHLEAATGRMRPTVVSGYMRDENKFLMSPTFSKNLGIELATYIHFSNSRVRYVGRQLASLIAPSPLFIELGNRDVANSVEYGRADGLRVVRPRAVDQHDYLRRRARGQWQERQAVAEGAAGVARLSGDVAAEERHHLVRALLTRSCPLQSAPKVTECLIPRSRFRSRVVVTGRSRSGQSVPA